MTITATWESRLLAQAYAPLENLVTSEAIAVHDSLLQKAYAHATAVTAQHSRTFYTSSALLPAAERRAIRALYAFCRVSDDLIDRQQENRAQQFRQWRQHALSSTPPEDDLTAVAWADARTRYAIPRLYAEQLLDGVARDLSFARYETFADLADYCYGVASTVGLMSMHITGFSSHEAIPYAVKLGVALQLTNILRDVAEDWDNGRCYLPQDELAAFGLTEADIAGKHNGHRWQEFMRFQIDRTRDLYTQAMPGINMLSANGRFAVAAAAELYRAILDDIEAHNYDVFTRRAHVNGRAKLQKLPGIWWRARWQGYTNS
ncbi:MAG: phytoene/squalene synthase family protein [Chloroflexi bacterium]|nr:phytoene/squalene synthase family protein [Chloroflexota bacterium]NOG34618.1 phytoene/squalene synthase family protein [Chloroflexota bacterium]GIK56698.1 MAG: squalene synthase [Chloroflexota bacterium]